MSLYTTYLEFYAN